MNNSSMEQLQKDYENSIRIQQEVIDKNREKLNKARKQHNFKEIQRLNRLLKTLYDEKWELEEKAIDIRRYLCS